MSGDECSESAYPFTFFDVNGTSVSGEIDDISGLCIFPDANCGLETSASSCCQAKDDLKVTGSDYMFIAFVFIFAPYLFLRFFAACMDKDEWEKAEEQDEGRTDADRLPGWVRRLPKIAQFLFRYGLWVYITLQIMVPILMRSSIQANLVVADRNALISAEAFLVPYREIFQFVEDIVLVRVNYALGSGDKELTDQLVHAGIAGSFATGSLAGLFATILGAIPAVLSALTNPGFANDRSLYPGCDFIVEDPSEVLPYWMMEAWAISGAQLSMVMSGFLLGAMEMETVGWLGSISIAMVPLIWFTRVNTATNMLLLLGASEFAADWVFPTLAVLYMTSPLGKDLRERTGVTLGLTKLYTNLRQSFGMNESQSDRSNIDVPPSFKQPTEAPGENDPIGREDVCDNEASGAASNETQQQKQPKMESTKTLLKEGLKIMVMDVAIQFCNSLTIYLALLKDGAVAYQLTALQSALPTYGIAYALGMGIMFKIAGPQLIANGLYKIFAILARLMVVCAFLLAPLIVGAVVPFRSGLAFNYGENACTYAKDSPCLPFYTRVFGPNGTGGKFTLPFTFNVFAVGASVEAIFFVLRAVLLSCVDLDYMLKCTGVALIVYIPVIIVATVVPAFGGEAAAMFLAMYIPRVVLIVLFLVRLEMLIRKMLRGEDGPWSKKASAADTTTTPSDTEADAQSARVGSVRSLQVSGV